jgi:hypothetical protein
LIILSSITDKLVCLWTQGAYPKARVDINLSSDDDTVTAPKPNVSAGQKAPAGNDAGASSAEPTVPNPISFGVPKQSDPSTADQVLTIVPPARGRGHKRPPPLLNRPSQLLQLIR